MHKHNATVDGTIAQLVAFNSANKDGARPAVTFRAYDFGATQMSRVPQILGNGQKDGIAMHNLRLTVEKEPDVVSCNWNSSPQSVRARAGLF